MLSIISNIKKNADSPVTTQPRMFTTVQATEEILTPNIPDILPPKTLTQINLYNAERSEDNVLLIKRFTIETGTKITITHNDIVHNDDQQLPVNHKTKKDTNRQTTDSIKRNNISISSHPCQTS